MIKKLLLLLAVLSVVIITACSPEEETNKNGDKQAADNNINAEENEDKSNEDDSKNVKTETWKRALEAPEIPETVKEVVSQPTGKFAHLKLDPLNPETKSNKKAMKVFTKLPKLGDNASKEIMDAYWQKTHELFHKNYPSPEELIDGLKYASFGQPDINDDRFQFKKHLNVEIILDASGSMANLVNGKTRMEIAKETILSFASALPEEARVGLRVYGHKGTGADSDMEMSCNSSSLVYQIQQYKEEKFKKALNKFDPAGWTPIALALEKAQQDLSKYPGGNNTNIIFLVSDGIATCGGDPVKVAKDLAESNVNPIVNIIGFGIGNEGQKQLKQVAESADGTYTTVENQEQLKNQLSKAQNIAEKWAKWKDGALGKAEINQSDNYFKIYDLEVTWAKKALNEERNVWYAWNLLKDKGYISEKAYDYLNSKKEEHYNMVTELGEKIAKELQKINNKKYEEAKQAIKEAYKQNVN